MTYISTTTASGDESISWSVSVQAGDVLVGVLSLRESASLSSITAPGWERAGSWSAISSGDPTHPYASVVVLSRTAASTGTLAGTVTIPSGRNCYLAVILLRDVAAVAGWAQLRMNSQRFVFPGVSLPSAKSGHVVTVATGTADWSAPPDRLPSGYTQRWSGGEWWWLSYWQPVRYWTTTAATGNFSSTAEIASAYASSTTLGDGYTLTLVVVDSIGPDAPTITTPAAGTVDLAAGFDISWEPVGTQTGYVVRRRTPSGSGTYYYWNGSNWTSTTEAAVTSTDTTLTVGAAEFSNSGTTYDIEVATVGDDSYPDIGAYASVSVTGIASPTAPSVSVSPTSGTDITSLTPEFTLSGSAGSGGTFTGYRVRLDQDTGTGWVEVLDSGVVSSPWTVSVAEAASLTNGAPIRIRAVTVQNDTQEGPETTDSTYTLDAATPSAPDVTVTAITHSTSSAPGWRVEVDPGTSGHVIVYRDGVLLAEEDITAPGILQVDDYWAPSAGTVYSATTSTGDGVSTVLLVSPTTTAAEAVMTDAHCWIIDPGHPELAVLAHIVDPGTREGETRSQAWAPLGSASWVVHSGVAVEKTSTRTVRCGTRDDETNLDAMLTSGRLLMQRGYTENTVTGPAGHTDEAEDVTFRVVGTRSSAHVRSGHWADRDVTFDIIPQTE